MAKYVHLFKTEADFNTARSAGYEEPWVSYTKDITRVDYNKPEDPFIKMPLTIEALESGVFKLDSVFGFLEVNIQYSKNGGKRTTITTGDTVNVNAGDTLELYGNNTTFYNGDAQTYFPISFGCNIYGNIMSIFNGDDFKTNSEFTPGYDNQCFNLFYGSKVVDASKLILPATTLASTCYQGMFGECTSLTSAPELPATTLADFCYYGMFHSCTALTTGPSILPATTLVQSCYDLMFNGCTSLNYIKCLATDITATGALSSWVENVAATGTFVKKAGVSWPSGTSGIPNGWTVQEV